MMLLPAPDPAVLARRAEIAADLRGLLAAADGVIEHEEELRAYETDGLSAYRQLPLLVVLPESTDEVSAILKYCHDNGIKVVARGAGTSLAGGALPSADAIVLGISRMARVLDIDYDNRTATVQPGVTNIAITEAVSHRGFFYAPDPSSQLACTIAGNVAMNSGGAHCLKYGVTANNLLGLEVVLMTGEVLHIGGQHLDAGGYDLLGLMTGSEGMLGVVTGITVRIIRSPEGARPVLFGFASNEDAGACVDAIIASGIIPVAIEFMDKPAIHAAENFVGAGYPLDVEALLIVEVEGSEDEIDRLLEAIVQIAEANNVQSVRASTSAAESEKIWKGRKSAFGAVGQISPDYYCMDGTIPTSALPAVLKRIGEISTERGFRVANIFHAGDGNLHPLILYDANEPGHLDGAEEMGAEILKLCVEVGGCLTGEHGVGVEKRELMVHQFTPQELAQQKRVKDVFDPAWLLNPAKVFPLENRAAQAAE
jgi:glycolate oxidase